MLFSPNQHSSEGNNALPVKADKLPLINLDGFAEGVQLHFWNQKKINLHDVLEAVLIKTGPSDVYLSTWSMGAPSVKKLLSLKNKGLITAINAVVDLRTRKDHAEAFSMALTFFDSLSINKCHAKVIALTGGNFPATIIGSANLTRNTKYERLCISTQPEVVIGDVAEITRLIKEGAIVK